MSCAGAGTRQIVASLLTTKDVDDGSQVGSLLDQVEGPLASFTGDGAYDQDRVTASVTERHPEAPIHATTSAMAMMLRLGRSWSFTRRRR